MFEKNGQKIVQPDDKEVVITRAEHRIMLAVQKDADERWRSETTSTSSKAIGTASRDSALASAWCLAKQH